MRRNRNTSTSTLRITRESSIADSDENAENESFISCNASSIRAKRSTKRLAAIELAAVNEEEENEEAIEVKAVKAEKGEKETIPQMLDKLCDGGKKSLIKMLAANPERLFAEATANQLRKVLWTTSVIISVEGLKLATLIFFEVGIDASTKLLKKRVLKEDIKPADCKNLGQLLLSVYRTAVKRDKADDSWDGLTGPLTDKVVECWTGIADAAMRIPGHVGDKFAGILHTATDMSERTKYERLISLALEPVLWRYLQAPHDQVRYAASLVLLRSFPIVDKVEPGRQMSFDKQLEHMLEMLVDECVEIRKEASKRVLRMLGHYYSITSNLWIKKLTDHIIMKNSRDSVPAVRAAVLDGFAELIPVPEAINVVDRGLKVMVPRLIEDRSEKVRQSAVGLLLKLRGHRHIKYFDVVKMADLMGRLECETSDAVRMDIVRLVHSSFLPRMADADEKNKRIALLVKFGRNSALAFHRLIVPLRLITLDEAVTLLKNLCIVVYKNWRKGIPEEGADLASVEGDNTTNFDTSAMSNTSIADASALGIPALDEDSSVFRRDKTILECAVVLWATIAKDLKKPSNETEKKRVDKLMAKIFKKMFVSFRQTSLLGTVMCIGSLLPSNLLEDYSIQILTILKDKTVDDEILEPYLEAGASWKLEDLIQIVRDGLYELPNVLPTLSISRPDTRSPVKKRAKKSKLNPVEKIRQALHYLKYSLASEPICSKLIAQCRTQLEECFEALSHVHVAVDSYLNSMDERDEELKALTGEDILSLYESATVLAVFMMEIPSNLATSDRATRSGRAASVGSIAAAAAATEPETEDEDAPTASPYSIFFFASLHWLEQSLLPRIGKCSSIERDKEQLQIRLAKVTLQHAETVLAACVRPPRTPTTEGMNELMKRLMGGMERGAVSSEEESEQGYRRRRSSMASSSAASAVSVPDPPQKTYLERLSAMLSALLHAKTPIVLLKSTLKLHEIIMGMENEEGEDARAQSYEVLKAAIGIVKRAAEMPHNGELLRHGHMDAVLAYARVVITKFPGVSFPFAQLMGVVRAHSQRLMLQAMEERGVEDVTEHTYELHPLVELLLHRFIFRHDKMFTEFRNHLEQFVLNWDPEKYIIDKDENGEELERSEGENEEWNEAMQADFKRFAIGCQLLRLSAPEIRKAVIKEKKNEKARRSIQSDIDTVAILTRLDKWKEVMGMDEGTETILREMIGPM